jgi:hypothetical protein
MHTALVSRLLRDDTAWEEVTLTQEEEQGTAAEPDRASAHL